MMKIRIATTNDAATMLAIYGWYIEHSAFSFELSVPTLKEYQKRIEKYSSEAPWLVLESEKELIGFAYASPHRGRAAYQWNREVSIYLKDNFHGKGVAQKLYGALFQLLKIQGYSNVLAGIVYPNPKSVKFHQKMGFQLVGRYRNIGFKFGEWRDVEWYELFLQEENYQPGKILSIEELLQTSEYQQISNQSY